MTRTLCSGFAVSLLGDAYTVKLRAPEALQDQLKNQKYSQNIILWSQERWTKNPIETENQSTKHVWTFGGISIDMDVQFSVPHKGHRNLISKTAVRKLPKYPRKKQTGDWGLVSCRAWWRACNDSLYLLRSPWLHTTSSFQFGHTNFQRFRGSLQNLQFKTKSERVPSMSQVKLR